MVFEEKGVNKQLFVAQSLPMLPLAIGTDIALKAQPHLFVILWWSCVSKSFQAGIC